MSTNNEFLPENEEVRNTGVSNNRDFWKDANDFVKNQLPVDFQNKIFEYAKCKGYNSNECQLFKYMLQEAVGFEVTMVILKNNL